MSPSWLDSGTSVIFPQEEFAYAAHKPIIIISRCRPASTKVWRDHTAEHSYGSHRRRDVWLGKFPHPAAHLGCQAGLRMVLGFSTLAYCNVSRLLLLDDAAFYNHRPVRPELEVDPEVQDSAGQRDKLARDQEGHRLDSLEPHPVSPASLHCPVVMDSGHRITSSGALSLGVHLAPDGSPGGLWHGVLLLALVPPQGQIPLPTRSRPPSRVLLAHELGHPVSASLGADQRWHLHHHLAMVLHSPPHDLLELYAVQHHGERGCSHRLWPAPLTSPMAPVLGWLHQARHAPPEAADQLWALLQLVGPPLWDGVPRTESWRLQTAGAPRLGREEKRVLQAEEREDGKGKARLKTLHGKTTSVNYADKT